jgi:hypothetical protein
MLNNPPFYNRTIRKIVVSFGTIFNEIFLQRYNRDGTVKKEIFKVPLSYGPKEKYLTRITADPTLTKSVSTVVPRIAFDMTGISYDTSRKQVSLTRNFALDVENKLNTQFVPVPYDFNFSLSIFVRNTEDGTQIVEQIVPFFTPDFTVTMKMVPELNLNMDVPIELITITSSDTYEGGFDSPRIQTWQLDFVIKGYLFGPVNKFKYIIREDVNLIDDGPAINKAIISTQTFTGNSEFEITEVQTNNNGYTP